MKKMMRKALGLAFLTALVSCGGGGSQISTFSPERVIVFGDESSYIGADGSKYTTNYVSDVGVADCANSPIWVQILAGSYGMSFPECPGSTGSSAVGVMRATVGGTLETMTTNIDAYLANFGFHDKDLVTVLIGANDLVNLFQRYPQTSAQTLIAAAEQAGEQAAEQVNRIATAGGRVVILTVPDLGLTPYALERDKFDPTSSAFLSQLTQSFNAKLRVNIINDGHKIGLVVADELLQQINKFPPGVDNGRALDVTRVACSVALPECTNKTMVAYPDITASPTTFLWADPLHLTAYGNSELGKRVVSRAHSNPF